MKYTQKVKKLSLFLITGSLFFSNISAQALSPSFSASSFFDNNDLYELPSYFQGKTRDQSINIIQQILQKDGSKLADLQVNIYDSDASFVQKNVGLAKNLGKTVSVAEFIWMLSREDLRLGNWKSMPINETLNPIFVLTLIQKESGLVYGKCSYSTCFDQSVNYRIARATGYACADGTGCDDWALGFFSQVYYGTRWYKAYTKFCQSGVSGFRGQIFKTGNTVNVYEGSVYLGTDVVCATYNYTPHDYPQKTFYQIFQNINDMAAQFASQNTQPVPTIQTTTELKPVIGEQNNQQPEVDLSISINNITTSDPMPTLSGKVSGSYDELKLKFGGEDEITIAKNGQENWEYKIKFAKKPGNYNVKIIAIKNGKRFVSQTDGQVVIEKAAPIAQINNLAEFVPTPKREESVVKEQVLNVSEDQKEEKKLEKKEEIKITPKPVVKIENPLSNIFNQSRFKQKSNNFVEKISVLQEDLQNGSKKQILETMGGGVFAGFAAVLWFFFRSKRNKK